MRCVRLLTALVAVAALAVSAASRAEEPPDAPKALVFAYRVVGAEGKATEAEVKGVAAVMTTRLARAEIEGATAEADPATGHVVLSCPASMAKDRVESARRLVAREGRVEFRVRSSKSDEDNNRPVAGAAGGAAKVPAEFQWVKRSNGGSDLLVETPERKRLADLEAVRARGLGDDAAETKSAKSAYDKIVSEEVFTGAQVGRSQRERKLRAHGGAMAVVNCVSFELSDARKKPFEAFTGLYRGRDMVTLLDGVAVAAFTIRDALPGAGVFSGAPSEFRDEDAVSLDAVFASGPLPRPVEAVVEDSRK